ncbi:MAG TPA: IclR family transcriptional regulator [Crenalkalicoccus sp.]|jgi:IclR family acetate operon transcriptional repressor|nr:IclR family transcriptional regulator [Crenalkalicoccus sp.]
MNEAIAPLRRRGRPASASSEASGDVQSLDRAMGLLEVLAPTDGLSLSELARQAELPPSTVHRLLTTLSRRGLVSHDPATGLWAVGLGLFRIGSAYLRNRKLPEIARPILKQLQAQVGETVNVSMLDRTELVCVAQSESHAPVRAFFRLGWRLPLHASAAGKAVLAAGSEGLQQELLQTIGWDPFTSNTFTTKEALLAEVARVRRRGWAIDDEEYTIGMRCASAAIRNEWAEPIGAISVSAPTVRMPINRVDVLGECVQDAAATLSELFSGRKPGA